MPAILRNPPKKPPARPRKAPAAPRATQTTPVRPGGSCELPGGFLEVEVLKAFSNHLAVKVLPGAVVRLPRDFAERMLETGMVRRV